jgi:hypothetical protein
MDDANLPSEEAQVPTQVPTQVPCSCDCARVLREFFDRTVKPELERVWKAQDDLGKMRKAVVKELLAHRELVARVHDLEVTVAALRLRGKAQG